MYKLLEFIIVVDIIKIIILSFMTFYSIVLLYKSIQSN